MQRRIGHLTAVLCVAVAIVSPQLAGAKWAAPHRHHLAAKTVALAGPWYTPAELQGLIAFSNASFEQQKVMLATAG